MNSANRSHISLRSTFSNCHISFHYLHSLYTHCCIRLNYCTPSMQCHACHQQTSVQPTSLMSTGL